MAVHNRQKTCGGLRLLENKTIDRCITDLNQYRRDMQERELAAQKRRRNKQANLFCGVDIDYLESLRTNAGLFVSVLAKELGVTLNDLRDYISFNKACPISFAQNWELTIGCAAIRSK